MGKKCKSCGEEAVEQDGDKEVCTSCGAMVSESAFASAPDEFSTHVSNVSSLQMYASGGLPNQFIIRNTNSIPSYIKLGKQKIEKLCSVMLLGKDLRDMAISLYTRLCTQTEKNIKHVSRDKKELFCCACVYIACREYDLPVTVTYIASLDGRPVQAYFSAANKIEQFLGIHIKRATISGLVEAIVAQEIQSGIVATNEAKNLTQDVLELMADLYLSQGRKPQALIAAAFFLAYQSEDFVIRRKLKSTKVFNRRLDVTHRLNLIRPSLLELLKGIPWVPENDHNIIMIPYYLKDIIKYKKTLMREALDRNYALNQFENSEENDDVFSGIDSNNSVLKSKEEIDLKKFQYDAKNQQNCTSSLSSSDVNMLNGEKQLKRHAPDDEYSDSENMKHYIKPSHIKVESEEPNTLFYPPAYKRARRLSREREEIQNFIDEGRETFEQLRKQMDLENAEETFELN